MCEGGKTKEKDLEGHCYNNSWHFDGRVTLGASLGDLQTTLWGPKVEKNTKNCNVQNHVKMGFLGHKSVFFGIFEIFVVRTYHSAWLGDKRRGRPDQKFWKNIFDHQNFLFVVCKVTKCCENNIKLSHLHRTFQDLFKSSGLAQNRQIFSENSYKRCFIKVKKGFKNFGACGGLFYPYFCLDTWIVTLHYIYIERERRNIKRMCVFFLQKNKKDKRFSFKIFIENQW